MKSQARQFLFHSPDIHSPDFISGEGGKVRGMYVRGMKETVQPAGGRPAFLP